MFRCSPEIAVSQRNPLSVSLVVAFFFFSSRRRHTRSLRDWSSDVCSSDLIARVARGRGGCGAMRAAAVIAGALFLGGGRSEERRVGKECRARGRPKHAKKKDGIDREWNLLTARATAWRSRTYTAGRLVW